MVPALAADVRQITLSVSLVRGKNHTTRSIQKGKFLRTPRDTCKSLTRRSYVEMLENQQAQLVSGLQELYRRLQAGETWDGPTLKETSRGAPLTHEILEHLGALKQDNVQSSGAFEENLEALQSKLLANGAGFMQREMSFDASSNASQSPMFEPATMHKAPQFSNPWSLNHFPPTPPFNSPRPSLVKTSSPLKAQMPMSMPQYTSNGSWAAEPSEFTDSMDFNMACDSPTEFDIHTMHTSTQMFFDPSGMAINPCLTMKDGWSNQDEQMNRYFQGGVFT